MECTQRLECTQDLNVSQLPEKIHPEQIAYLGICGEQYPIVKGPNKIGRDPQTCDIVLNLNSISRQHAVINILNQKQYMLMDLKSANKTKLLDKTLPPYIPYPLKNGDTVQFGDVFGIFVLLEDNNDLPETQAIDIPETPVISKHISKVNHATVTMVPESPDVSDRDDSFILASQPKKDNLTSPNKKYIKNSGKTITIQPIGSNKIDNVYWNSSKKSCSINLSLDDSNDYLNNSVNAEAVKNTELEKDVNDIHELETQVPYINEIDDATHSNVDKISCNKDCEAQSIHAMETQIPSAENLPEVCKINEQFEMQCDLYTSNKKNENSIYSAETESFQKCDNNTSLNTSKSQINKNMIAESDEEILFEEMEDQDKMDNLSSQPLLLPTEPTKNHNDELDVLPLDSPKQEILLSKTSKRKNVIDSDSSTDCDDFDVLSTQKITEKNDNNENVTDCEEQIVDNKIETKASNYQNSNPDIDKVSIDDDLTDCEDDLEIDTQNSQKNNSGFENMITQKIVENINLNSESKSNNLTHNKDEEVDFEDMPTQVITATEDNNFEDQLTQVIPQKTNIMQTNNICSQEIVSPFKIPFVSPIKINRKDIPRLATPKPSTSKDSSSTILSDDEPYYAATQEIFDDLCSQKDSPKNCLTNLNNNNTIPNPEGENVNDEMVPCSVEEYELGDKFHHITNELSPIKKCLVNDKSSECSESEERIKRYVANLSDKQIRDVAGVECKVKKPVKVPSDPSDLEDTPKKNRPFKFMEIDLPDSQEMRMRRKDEEVDFEDMPTQVITATEDNNFEDQLTQVIPQKTNNICSQEIVSPFKIPFVSPIKINRKDIPRLATPKPSTSKDSSSTILSDDEPYYAATQEIFDDLCSQKDSPKNCLTNLNNNNTIPNPEGENVNDEMVPCSVEEYELGDKFHDITNELSPIKKCLVNDKSSECSESEERIKRYVANLSDKQIIDVVGVECNVKKPVKVPSDPSDLEDTPKKNRPFKFMEIDLPDSQEIKASVSTVSKILVTESSSESEAENNSEECTPILFRHKKQTRKKIDETKVDLTKRFEVETLPTRVIIRNRKPTAKAQGNILKNKLFSEQENDIDSEILVENLSRLRNQNKSNIINIKKDEKRYKGANTVQSELEIEPQKRAKIDLSDKATKNKSSKRKNGKRTNETSDKTSCDLKLVQSDESSNPTDKKKTNKKTVIDCSDKNSTTKSGDTTIPLNDKVELKETCASDTKRSVRAARTNRKKYENTPEKRTTRKKSANSKKSQISSEKNKTIEKHLDKETIKEISSVKSEREEKLSLKSVPKESLSKKNVKRSHDSSPEVLVVRRSKRQKANNKDKKEAHVIVDLKPEKPKSILKNCRSLKNDQSAVYNISSGSNSDSPRSLKRTAADVADAPSSKRAKTSSASSGNTSIRSTPARNVRTPHVLFTAFPESIVKDVSGKLEKLGAIVVTDVTDCTVLVTQQMKRTFKLLCAVALGRPIVGPNWIQACHDTNMIVDPWLYLMKDEAAEKRFHFNLRRTLVGKRNFLRGYSVSCTPSVRPTAPELKLIVECSGGTWSSEGGGNGGDEGARRVCVSCAADRALWPALRRRGASLVGTEFILCGVLQQQADVDHYLLK